MYEAEKARQITKRMSSYKLNILGLCEIRWTCAGQTQLATGERVLYSRHEQENASHKEGVALMLTRQAQKALGHKRRYALESVRPHLRLPAPNWE
jgi:hypothetical protein